MRHDDSDCAYFKYRTDMHGVTCLGCRHPKRKSVYSLFAKIIDFLIPTEYKWCAARDGYERYCPLYKKREQSVPLPPKKWCLGEGYQPRKTGTVIKSHPPKKSGLWRKKDHKKDEEKQ